MSDPVFKFLLNEGINDKFLPTRAHSTDTGWDVRAASDYIILPEQYIKIDLGFRMFAPPGWWLELRPRSSSFAKKNLHALYGVIDETFEGNCVLAAQYLPDKEQTLSSYLEIKAGDAIGQVVPVKRQNMKVERVSNEEYQKLCQERNANRGEGGFGSTG